MLKPEMVLFSLSTPINRKHFFHFGKLQIRPQTVTSNYNQLREQNTSRVVHASSLSFPLTFSLVALWTEPSGPSVVLRDRNVTHIHTYSSERQKKKRETHQWRRRSDDVNTAAASIRTRSENYRKNFVTIARIVNGDKE